MSISHSQLFEHYEKYAKTNVRKYYLKLTQYPTDSFIKSKAIM